MTIKTIIIGDSGVGKTSLMKMFFDKEYNDNEEPTFGIDFRKTPQHQVFDIGGQDRFKTFE